MSVWNEPPGYAASLERRHKGTLLKFEDIAMEITNIDSFQIGGILPNSLDINMDLPPVLKFDKAWEIWLNEDNVYNIYKRAKQQEQR